MPVRNLNRNLITTNFPVWRIFTMFTSKATGDWAVIGEVTWNEAGHPQPGDSVTIQNTHVVSIQTDAGAAIVIIDSGGSLFLVAGDLFLTGQITNSGTLDIKAKQLTCNAVVHKGVLNGLAAGKLICTSFDGEDAAASKGTIVQGFQIECSGDWLADNNKLWDVDRVDLKLTGNGFIYRTDIANYFYQFEHATGAKHTVTATSYVSGGGDGDCTLNGWWVLNQILVIRFDSAGVTSLGAGFMVSGSNDLNWACDQTRTLTVSNSIAEMAAWTGDLNVIHTNNNDQYALTLNIPNANFKINGRSVAIDYQLFGNDLICNNFTITNALTGTPTIDNATGNKNITLFGDMKLNEGIGVYTTVWTRSATVVITLKSASGTHDLDNQTMEDIIIFANAQADFGANAFTCRSLFIQSLGQISAIVQNTTIENDLTVSSGSLLDFGAIGTTNINVQGDLNGSGTIQSVLAATITLTGSNNFTGSLVNVTIV